MRRKLISFAFWMIVLPWCPPSAAAQPTGSVGPHAGFVVTATLDKAPSETIPETRPRIFVVSVDLQNNGDKDSHIVYWVAGQSSWVTDNANFVPAHNVQQDSLANLTLKANQHHYWKVLIEDWRRATDDRPMSFRLGFLPNGSQPLGTTAGASLPGDEITKRGGITWSNVVTAPSARPNFRQGESASL